MTFNQAEVVGVTSFTGTSSGGTTTTLYTVPAGKYAVININGIRFYNATSTTAGRIEANGARVIDVISGSEPFLDEYAQSVTLQRTHTVILTAGQTLTANTNGSMDVGGTALEFNLP